MARGTQRRSEGLGAHAIFWLFLIALVFSLGFYERGTKSWRDEATYQMRADRIAFGAPLPWIEYDAVVASGAPPPLELLPEGQQYSPGVHIDWPRACIAITSAMGVAFVLFIIGWFAWPKMQRRGEVPRGLAVLAIALLGAGVGAVTPTDPAWVGIVLGMVLLPLVIAGACWRGASFVPVAMCSGLGVLSMLWSQRITALVRPRHDAADFDLHADVYAPMTMFAMYVLIVSAIVTVKRLVTR
jgi:hypothetical protein